MRFRVILVFIGIVIGFFIAAPIRSFLSQFILSDKCERLRVFQGNSINENTVYNLQIIDYLRKNSCDQNKFTAKHYYNKAVKALTKRKVDQAKKLATASILYFPTDKNLLLIGELNLIRSNRRFNKQKNLTFFIRDYKYSKKKFQIAYALAKADWNHDVMNFSLRRINCINRAIRSNAKGSLCGGYRRKR